MSDTSDRGLRRGESRPSVSVIIATYNRANVLRYTIESVRRQTLTDWEMWVVGDACTDETECLVRRFADPRIRFFNLLENAGDQSGPNNEGFRRSRGRFVAWLNHDDLWFSDHLEQAVKALEETGADLVWPLVVKLRTDGIFTCADLDPERRYAPHLSVPASFWVLRRELVEEMGPWRHHSECHATPSQEWLFRAFRAGKDMRYIRRMTAIALPSGGRPGVYAKRESDENRAIFERMRDEGDFRETVLLGIAEHHAVQQSSPPVWNSAKNTFRDLVHRRLARYWGSPCGRYSPPLWQALYKRLRRVAGAIGLHPESCELLLQYGRRGNFVRFLRRFRGLVPASPGATPQEKS